MANNLERVLRLMAEKSASDVYMSANTPILIKINGQIMQLSDQVLTTHQTRQLLSEMLAPQQLEELDDTGELNVGISVSRVGGNAQRKAMKKVAGTLRLDLAAFRELEAFAQLGTELDPATQRQLDRGQRMVELLKQPQYRPYPVSEQIISIFAAAQGFLDDLPVPQVRPFEAAMLKHFRDELPEILEQLDRTGEMPNDLADRIRQVIRDFKTHASAA